MSVQIKLRKLLFQLSAIMSFATTTAQITLPKIVSNGMVLQRNENVNIWGWASSGETIKIKFNKKSYSAITGKDGVWLVKLSPMKAGGPYTMEIKGKNTIVLNDILIGDVWLCAGQSNMVHQMRLHNTIYANEIKTAENLNIRQFFVPNTVNLNAPQSDVLQSAWKAVNNENIGDFSAVAYFFAKKLYADNKVPIGIVNASWAVPLLNHG